MKKPRADKGTTQAARRYIADQLAVMERFGSRPRLSRATYWQLVRDVCKPVLALQKARAANRPPQEP